MRISAAIRQAEKALNPVASANSISEQQMETMIYSTIADLFH